MARQNGNGTDEKATLTDRRTLLKAAGASTVALGLGSTVGTASAIPVTEASTVVDLGEQGLESGDSIDPYLDEHFASDTEVHVPAGQYRYTGAGLDGEYTNAAIVGSPTGVVFHRPDDPETQVRPTITAAGGTVRIENVTISGQRGQAQSHWRVGADSGARFEVVNVNLPHGSVAESESTGLYAGSDHAGTLVVRNCHFANFANVALHVSDPSQGGNGRVGVDDCTFVNNGCALRFAPDGSVVRGSYFEASEQAPTGPNGGGQSGITIDDPGTDVVVEDCDFNWGEPGTAAIDFAETGSGGGGVVRDVRVQHTGLDGLFTVGWSIGESWSGENVNLVEA